MLEEYELGSEDYDVGIIMLTVRGMEHYDCSYNVVDYNVSTGGNYNGGGENLEKANNPSQTL